MSIKNIVRRLILGYKATSDSYIRHLKKVGVDVGENIVLFRPFNTTIDVSGPHMLTIGSHVMITGPVTILTHDYSWSVIKRKYGDITGKQRKTVIGNNTFIGWGTTILPGTQMGDNVIIGAGSVVSGIVQGDSVYAGNPARRIMSLEVFYEKRKAKQLEEAVAFVQEYEKRYQKLPEEKDMKEYFFLFSGEDELCPELESQLQLMENREQSAAVMKERKQFDDFDLFLDYCMQQKNKT